MSVTHEYDTSAIIKDNYTVKTFGETNVLAELNHFNSVSPRLLFLALLNDQEGPRCKVEFTDELSYEFLSEMLNCFLGEETADDHLCFSNYELLMETGYFVSAFGEDCHFVMAIDNGVQRLTQKGVYNCNW